MRKHGQKESVSIWRPRAVSGLELMRATFFSQNFSRHYHEGYAFGVIEDGALGFDYLGRRVVAGPGEINLCVPGEAHNGFAAGGQGWRYRMFYLDAGLMQTAASELAGRAQPPPFFTMGVIRDPELAGAVHGLHCCLEDEHGCRLEQESRLWWLLARLIIRHGEGRLSHRNISRSHPAVRQAREYIEDHHADNLSLADLCRLTNLSRFHLLRLFAAEVGLPPHTYLTQVRVRRAAELLARGRAIADAALEAGFTDQSHLNRWFKRILGVTPGAYRNIVQD